MNLNLKRFSAARLIASVAVVILIIYGLFSYSHWEPSPGDPAAFPGFTAGDGHPAVDTACRVWLDVDSASPLAYDKVAVSRGSIPVVGDASVLGDAHRCLLARPRLDQYKSSADRDFTTVKWGQLQRQCASSNPNFAANSYDGERHLWHVKPTDEKDLEPNLDEDHDVRSAIVLRTWDNYDYSDVRRQWIRALISETALHSHGKYEVIFLVNSKNKELDLADKETYDRTLAESVPEEFRDMALVYNERVLEDWYPRVSAHDAQDHMYQALQILSHKFPHFTHFWQFEMDARFTAHMQTILESARSFALKQPRRNLWERNGRYYIPELWDRNFTSFAAAVDKDIGESGVWGPAPATNFVPKGPTPPLRSEKEWGIDEEPDLIGFTPMIDPIGTEWVYEKWVNEFPDGVWLPRRAAFISMTRSSRRLLQLISEYQRETGAWVVSEAMLETFSLLHGLKAVTIPHAIALHSDWDPERANKNINRGPAHAQAGGLNPSSSYTLSGWPEGPWQGASYWCKEDSAQRYWDSYMDGKCLALMMLHPIKD